MSSIPKRPRRTKRTQKAIAFRARKGKATADLDDDNDVPILEHQDAIEGGADVAQSEKGDETGPRVVRGDRPKRPKRPKKELVGSQKRKREAGEEAQGPDEPTRKRRRSSGGLVDGEGDGEGEKQKKQRLILFLGNIKYTTTIEAIQAHFSACDTPPTVRLLTPKPTATKPVTKSKGCAFLEFQNQLALQQALKLHHSQLDGRMINVELTAGGGGRGEARLKKVKERNKELEGRRRKRVKKTPSEAALAQQDDGARRFSATSGAEQVHDKKRTWSVGQVEETGVKKQRARRTKPKRLGTGVNAIPVG